MHSYHIAYDAPGVQLQGHLVVDFEDPLTPSHLDIVKAGIRKEYGYSNKVEIILTSIFKFEDPYRISNK